MGEWFESQTPIFAPGESPWAEEPGGLTVHGVEEIWT